MKPAEQEQAIVKELHGSYLRALAAHFVGDGLLEVGGVFKLYHRGWHPYILMVLTNAAHKSATRSVLTALRTHAVGFISQHAQYQGYGEFVGDIEHPTHVFFRELYKQVDLNLQVPKKPVS